MPSGEVAFGEGSSVVGDAISILFCLSRVSTQATSQGTLLSTYHMPVINH